MSDLDNAINSINASAAKAENTATFLDDMSTFDDQSSVTNPNNGQTVASIPKQVKDRTDELFTSAESDINQAVSDAAQSATDAQDAADSIGRYQGLWPDTGGSADKGDTYQTQASGTPTGQYFTALQNTTVDPVGDDINWRSVVSVGGLSKYTDLVYASVADMISGVPAPASVGDTITTYSYNTTITQYWVKVLEEPTDFSGGYYVGGGEDWFVLIQDYGNIIYCESIGFDPNGTHSFNNNVIQTALAVIKDSGAATLAFRDYANQYVNVGSNIQLHRGVTVMQESSDSGGAFNNGLLGDGTGPVFITGTYTPGGPNAPSSIREITFKNLSVTNENYTCIQAYAPNITVDGGKYACTDAATVEFRFAFRSCIKGGRHRASFSTYDANNYCITAYDNINGFYITPETTISGGSNGGGVDVSQSQKVNIDGIYETMGNPAVRVAGYTGVERGNCNAVKISGYVEACDGSVSVGEENRVKGLEFGELYASQFGSANPEKPIITLGKVAGVKGGASMSLVGTGVQSAIYLTSGAAGSGVLTPSYMYLEGVQTTNVLDEVEVDTSFLPSQVALALNSGRVQVGESATTGVKREYISTTIQTNVGNAQDLTFIGAIETSGYIDKVELMEVEGSLSGAVLRIGDDLSTIRNLNYDLTTAVPVKGYIDVTDELSITTLRKTESTTFRVVPGAGSGSFRFKVTYRA